MTIIETVFVVASVINILLLCLVFYLVVSIVQMKTYINQMHVGMASILNKLFTIEQSTAKIGSSFTEFIKMSESVLDKLEDNGYNQVYRTADGKFSAKTIDELISKIKDSGEETEYFSDDELNKLKGLFEQDEDDDNYDEEE